MKLIIFLKTVQKDCHLKTDTVVCDSCEINCIEESSLHVYFSTFYVPWKSDFFFLKIGYTESLLELILK